MASCGLSEGKSAFHFMPSVSPCGTFAEGLLDFAIIYAVVVVHGAQTVKLELERPTT